MAGSLRKFRYTSDDGNDYDIERDESNTEALNGTTAIPTDTQALPKRYYPRYAVLASTTTRKKRTVVILSPTTFQDLNGATDYILGVVGDADGETFRISALIGERRERLIVDDTGDDDGDTDPSAP